MEAVNRLILKPRYLVDIDDVNFTTTIFGQSFAVPFGVAPIGLGGGYLAQSGRVPCENSVKIQPAFLFEYLCNQFVGGDFPYSM